MKLIGHFDGLCEPNPNGLAIAAWTVQAEDIQIGQRGWQVGYGSDTSNQIAEYHALLGVLEFVAGLPLDKEDQIEIRGDSQVVVRQVNGTYACRAEHLIPLRDAALRMIQASAIPITLTWIPRAENAEADMIARSTYVSLTGTQPPER